MDIALTTPSGNVGRHLVGHLVRAGVRPRVLTRHPDALDPLHADHVDAREVDLFDADAVAAATEGVDACYLVVPSLESEDPVADYARIGAGFAAAMAANGVARTVLQSSVGAEKRHGAGEIDGLARVEEALDGAGLPAVTHLRCGYFMSNLLLDETWRQTGLLEGLLPTDAPMAWVAPADIAAVAAGLLLNPDWRGRRVQAVHGPADLTWEQVAAVLTTVTGREVRAARIADDVMRDRLASTGVPDGMVEAILGMSTGLRDGFVPEQPRDATTTTPTTLGAWAWAELT